MARTILIITGDAGERFETLYARQRLTEAGFTPRIAAPSKRRLNLGTLKRRITKRRLRQLLKLLHHSQPP